MAQIDQTANTDVEICWARGDDDPKTFTVRDSTGVIDISTWTLSMSVNTEKNPANTVNEIFQVAGAFVTDGTDGQIMFTPPPTSLDNVTAPGAAFYEIVRLTPSKKTLIKGKVVFVMDIDKV